MTGESIFNIFTKSVLQDLLKKLKIEFTNSWKKDKLVELLCEGDLKKALNKMTTEQLKVVLGEMKLSQSGKKSALIDRILDGEVGGENNNDLLGDAVAQVALQEFNHIIRSEEDWSGRYDLMDEYGGEYKNFKQVCNIIHVERNDHRRIERVEVVIEHKPSKTYIAYFAYKLNGEFEEWEEEGWIVEAKKIERVLRQTILLFDIGNNDFQCDGKILSETITSEREIK